MSSFKKEDYRTAKRLFQKVILESENPYRENSLLLLGITNTLLGEHSDAAIFLNRSFGNYTDEKLLLLARYMSAFSNFSLHQYSECLKDISFILGNKEFITEHPEVVKNYLNLPVDKLNYDELKTYTNTLPENIPTRNYLYLKIIQKALQESRTEEAVFLFNLLKRQDIDPEITPLYDSLRKMVDSISEAPIFIGVISSFYKDTDSDGSKFLEGAEFAVKKYNETTARKIHLLPINPEGDKIKSIQSIRDVVDYINLAGLIGPLNPDIQIGTMIEANYSKIPIIAPFANVNGLSTIGEYTFQLNATNETHAKKLADYAMSTSGMKTFAVLAPIDKDGQELADSFTEEVDRLGGKILAQQWYIPGSVNFATQFKSIRSIGLNTMLLDSLFIFADSLFLDEIGFDTLSAGQQDSIRSVFVDTLSIHQIDSLKTIFNDMRMEELLQLGRTYIDSTDIPVTCFDAIYIPLKKNEIKYMASQYAFHNFRSQLLGSYGWHDIEELSKHDKYLSNIIFSADYFLDESNSAYRSFRNEFYLEKDRTPLMLETYGYVCARIYISAIENRNATRDSIRDYLNGLKDYQSIIGKITLSGTNRANKNVRILRYGNGMISSLR